MTKLCSCSLHLLYTVGREPNEKNKNNLNNFESSMLNSKNQVTSFLNQKKPVLVQTKIVYVISLHSYKCCLSQLTFFNINLWCDYRTGVYTYHSPVFAEYTPMCRVWIKPKVSGISQR